MGIFFIMNRRGVKFPPALSGKTFDYCRLSQSQRDFVFAFILASGFLNTSAELITAHLTVPLLRILHNIIITQVYNVIKLCNFNVIYNIVPTTPLM